MRNTLSLSDFEIERASNEDTALLLCLLKELAEYEGLMNQVIATEEDLRHALFGQAPCAEAIIGYYHDQPVSCATFYLTFSTFNGSPGMHLEDLYVRPHMRSQGIGSAMLIYLACLAKTRGCGRLEWCSFKGNEKANRFYRRMGAASMDELIVFRVAGQSLERWAEQA